MSSDDKMVAATLAAALVAKGEFTGAIGAVSAYRFVVTELEKTDSQSPVTVKRLGY